MNKIKALRLEQGMKQSDLAKQLQVKQNTISNWETGRTEPDADSLKLLASIFSVSTDYLLGNDGPTVIRAPVLGKIPAGVPLEAIEDILDWEELPPEMGRGGKEYFGLQVRGDSMYPEYLDGDVVILQKTPCCENGDTCAVLVNGDEATLKQVKLGEDGTVTLKPRNPEYAPRTYSPNEVEDLPVSILGVVVELRRKIKK